MQYDASNRVLKTYTLMVADLVFVPEQNVPRYFNLVKNYAPEELSDVVTYFGENYVAEKPACGTGKKKD